MSFSKEIEDTIKNEFIRKLIIEVGEPLAERVLSHRIITSLAGMCSDGYEIPRAQLEIIRQRFYLQDYFYLVYGYKVPQLFLRECSTNQDLSKPNAIFNSNPLYSDTINQILPDITSRLKGSRPNSATRDYILSKLNYTFQGDFEAIISALPCLQLYSKFHYSEIFKGSPYYLDISPLREWIKFLASDENFKKFKNFCKVCDNLATNYFFSMNQEEVNQMEEKLLMIYVKSWDLELDFFQSLLK